MPPLLSVDSQGLQAFTYPENGTGATLVGALRFAADGSIKFSGETEATAVRIQNIAMPAFDTDAANKKYVDDAIKGLTLKAPVRCCSTGPVSLLTLYAGVEMDSTILVAEDRVLLRHQAAGVENGIYRVQEAPAAPVRASDFATGSKMDGVYCFVDEGAAAGGNIDRSFICTSAGAVDTASQEWVQFAARPEAYKGDGLKMGTHGALDVDNQVVPYLGTPNIFTGTNTFQTDVYVQSRVSASVAVVDTIPSNTTTTGASRIQDAWQSPESVNGPQYHLGALPAYQQHAINWRYLYNTMNGLTWKDPVRAVCQTDLGVQGLNALIGPVTIDGVDLVAGNRVLITGQTTDGVLNGVYRIVTSAPPVRTDDMPVGANVAGWVIVSMEGILAGDKAFLCTTNSGQCTIGTHAVNFELMGQSPEQLAGNGIVVSGDGTSLNVQCDNSTIEFDAGTNSIRIKGGVSNAVLGDKSNVMTQPVEFQDGTASVSTTTGAVTVVGGVGVTGNVHCQGVYHHSDERLKDAMVPLGARALSAVSNMGGYEFTWKSSQQRSVGVLAQEVQSVAPLVVEDRSEFLSVDYTKLVPYLIEAVKELNRRLQMATGTTKPTRARGRRSAQVRIHRRVCELLCAMN